MTWHRTFHSPSRRRMVARPAPLIPSMVTIEPVNTRAIQAAAERLRQGNLVAFPTETVYGLGADTFNAAAIRRIYETKGRPTDNPLIAHVDSVSMARGLCRKWTDRADSVASVFWPGPLTVVLTRDTRVPSEATGGRYTIAIRSPSHPAAMALLNEFGSAVSGEVRIDQGVSRRQPRPMSQRSLLSSRT